LIRSETAKVKRHQYKGSSMAMSYNEKHKQSREWLILNRFKDLFDDFPGGRILKTESPDFVIRSNRKKTTGIELTSILNFLPGAPPDGNNHETPELTPEVIETTILRKEQKLGMYRRKKTDSIWLIIEVHHTSRNTPYNLANKIDKWSFNSAFQKVFLFDTQDGKIFELNSGGGY